MLRTGYYNSAPHGSRDLPTTTSQRWPSGSTCVDGEVLSAARRAEALLQKLKATWADLLDGSDIRD
jgi:hypothetical protein